MCVCMRLIVHVQACTQKGRAAVMTQKHARVLAALVLCSTHMCDTVIVYV